ncbi:hypothetical protein CEXT_238391 [Caerostris extrusa]|uniref:Uncharacterized protein n=1 Tax=Caerostris extrusa TaxID=172846 RepID=A0AAV4T309_CAEEX|nr:hypothetical protein CEXT_238391 [Caerostris extrusa]
MLVSGTEKHYIFHDHVHVKNGSQLRDSAKYRCISSEYVGGEIFSFQQFLLTLYNHALYFHAGEKAGLNLNFEWGAGDFTYGIKGGVEVFLEKGIRDVLHPARDKKWFS